MKNANGAASPPLWDSRDESLTWGPVAGSITLLGGHYSGDAACATCYRQDEFCDIEPRSPRMAEPHRSGDPNASGLRELRYGNRIATR
jgi:hypothetical protein